MRLHRAVHEKAERCNSRVQSAGTTAAITHTVYSLVIKGRTQPVNTVDLRLFLDADLYWLIHERTDG